MLNYAGFANWTVSNGTVDLIGNGYFDFQPGNGLYVDMDGSTGNAGKMSHSFNLAPGQYTLSYQLAGNHRNWSEEWVDVLVGLGPLVNASHSLSRSTPFTTFFNQFSVGTQTAATLSFEGRGGDNIGMLLDNVRLEKTDPVPEPPTLVLLATGVFGLAGMARRKKKSS